MKPGLLKGVLLLGSIAAALLLGEFALRLLRPSGYHIWPPDLTRQFRPVPNVMPGISGVSVFATNSAGLRGAEPAPSTTYRFVAIGGSTTECLYLDQSETWPHLLQTELNAGSRTQEVWIGNAGMSGRTMRHHIAALRHLPLRELEVNAVILLAGANDFMTRLSQDDSYDPDYLSTATAARVVMAETFTGSSYRNPDERFFQRTAVWQLVEEAMTAFQRRVEIVGFQDAAGEVYLRWRAHRRSASEIRSELPDLTDGLREYARNINRMLDIAEQRAIRVILVTQPTIWRRDLPEHLEALLWMGGIGDYQAETGKIYYSAEAMHEGMERYNSVLLEVCRARGAECVDLASELEKDTTVFYDDMHFNESGATQVAGVLAAHILERNPFAEIGDARR